MKLTRTVVKEGSFSRLLKLAQTGDIITLYEGEFNGWKSHPKGVVIQQGNKLLLNGTKLLYGGEFGYYWSSHPQGVVIQQGNKLLLNGTKLLYEGTWDNWSSHPQGVVIRQGDKLLLNGTKLLYRGEFNDWSSHSQGMVIEQGKKLLLVVYKTKRRTK